MSDKTKTITVTDMDCAIILRSDGALQMIVPDYSDDSEFAENEALVLSFGLRLAKDPDFGAEMKKWLTDEMKKDGYIQ